MMNTLCRLKENQIQNAIFIKMENCANRDGTILWESQSGTVITPIMVTRKNIPSFPMIIYGHPIDKKILLRITIGDSYDR